MSKLLEFRKAEEALRRQLALLEDMKKDKELSHEMEFENSLKALIAEFGYSPRQAVAILQPQPVDIPQLHLSGVQNKPAADSSPKRRQRRLQVWKNPHTGEVLETKSGNNKQLKAWKAEFGESAVAGWLQQD